MSRHTFPLFLHLQIYVLLSLKSSTLLVCLSGAQRRIHDGEAVPEGKKKSGATPCSPHIHSLNTKTHTKAAQLVLAEAFYTKQSREREGQRQ